jgi:hypothetical protein
LLRQCRRGKTAKQCAYERSPACVEYKVQGHFLFVSG